MFRGFGRRKTQELQDGYNPPEENKRLSFLQVVGRVSTKNTTAVIEPDSEDEKSAPKISKGQSNRSNDNKHDDASYASSLTSQSYSKTRQHDSYQSSSQRIVEEEDSGAGLSAEEKFMSYFQQKRASESVNQSKPSSQQKMETAALSTHVDVSDDEDVYNSGDHLAMMAAAARKDEDQKRKQREAEEARRLQQQQEEAARLQRGEEEQRLQSEQVATESAGQLTEEQRRAKARQAVEDRKRKAREAVEARKAKARQSNAANVETQDSPDAGDGQMLVDSSKQSDEALREKQRLLEEAEAARKAQQEKERLEREQAEQALQEKLRQEEEDLRRQQEELRQEELRLEEEMLEAQEKARVEEEFRKLEEEERLLNEEMARLDEEALHGQTEAVQYEQYNSTEEEATPAVAEDDDDETLDEVQRQAEEWIAAEAQKLVKQAKLAEEAQRAAEEREKEEKLALEKAAEEARKAAEEARLEEERRDTETRLAVEARLDEERRQAEARLAEEARLEEERRQAEEARIAEEAKLEEERRQAEEARIAEEAKLEEERRQAEKARIAEEARLEEERLQVEEARAAAEQLVLEQARQVEEARLALERFTDEQNSLQPFQVTDTIDDNHDDTDNHDYGELVEEHDDYDIEPSETDLSALLGGDEDALFDSALDGPAEPVSPVKNKSIIRNSFSKILSRNKNKVTEKKKKENMGLRFYKPKSESKDISTEKTTPAPTNLAETTKVQRTPPKPPSAPPTKRVSAPQKSLPPPARHEPEPQKQQVKTPDLQTVETVETLVSHVPETNHKAASLAARGFPLRRGKKGHTKSPRNVPQSPARSVDSTGSVASIDRIPRSPYMKLGEDEEPGPSCSNPYHPTLHVVKDACQICVFRLSEADRERFEKNGRSLLVNTTAGGCVDCTVFPSHEGEDPVRICRQCFFNTHLQCKREEEAFAGPGALVGALHRPRYVNGRPSL